MAPEFLREAKERLAGNAAPLFDEASGHYEEVSRSLDRVAEAYPFGVEYTMDPIGVDEKSAAAAKELTNARKAEEAGLGVLRKIVDSLA
jgi:hypothetical protein